MPDKIKKKSFKSKRSEENSRARNRLADKKRKAQQRKANKESKVYWTQPEIDVLESSKKTYKNRYGIIKAVLNGEKPLGSRKYNAHIPDGKSNGWRRDYCEILDFVEKKRLEWVEDEGILAGISRLVDYRHYWIRKPSEYKVKFHNTYRQFSTFVRHLLTKYEVPLFMDSAWTEEGRYSPRECRWFIDVGIGKNIRKCEDLPIALTKKMAHWFTTAPKNFTINQAFRWAQVLGEGGGERAARNIAGTHFLGVSFVNDDFWISVIRFFINNPMLDPNQYDPIIDYINNQKYRRQPTIVEGEVVDRIPQPGFSMHGRDPNTLIARVEEWHAELNSSRISNYKDAVWKHCDIKDFAYELGQKSNKQMWDITQLLSAEQLYAEGRTMNHCVGSYASSCAIYHTTIWAMTLSNNSSLFQAKLTIEIDFSRRQITQARGKNNRGPNQQEMSVINRWASKENLTISRWLSY